MIRQLFYIVLATVTIVPAAISAIEVEEHIYNNTSSGAFFQDIPYPDKNSSNQPQNDFTKKLILIIDRDHTMANLDSILKKHNDIMFMDHEIPSLSQSAGVSESEMIQSLYHCHPAYLAYIVDYINDQLLQPTSRPWCGSHTNTKLHLASHGKHTTCRPASKSKVNHFCRHHHLAVKVAQWDTIQEIRARVEGTNLRIIDSMEPHSEGNRRILEMDKRVDKGKDIFNGDDDSVFLLRKEGHFVDILELFNYLDIHLSRHMMKELKKKTTYM